MLLNAGAALYIAGKADTFADGVALAADLIDSGKALAALEKVVEVSNRPEYEAAGVDAISVLTEPKWFLGSDNYLRKIAQTVSIPCLRKDFTVDEYIIYQARLLGASAVLLICSILSDAQLNEYLALCRALGLSALVEAHDKAEVERALASGAAIIGVNNRNLKDFTVDTANSRRLRSLLPPEVRFVSESDVRSPADVQALREIGADAVLVGEALMRAPDKAAMLVRLKGAPV